MKSVLNSVVWKKELSSTAGARCQKWDVGFCFLKLWMLEDFSQTKAARDKGSVWPWSPWGCLSAAAKTLEHQAFLPLQKSCPPRQGTWGQKWDFTWNCQCPRMAPRQTLPHGSGWPWPPPWDTEGPGWPSWRRAILLSHASVTQSGALTPKIGSVTDLF